MRDKRVTHLRSIIWGWDGGLNSRSVDMYVSRLRARLKELGIGWSIQSVHRKGYRLNLAARESTPAVPDEFRGRAPREAALIDELTQ